MSGAFVKSLGQTSFNVASTTMALTTTGAVASNNRLYLAAMWAGTTTISGIAGGGLTYVIDHQSVVNGFGVGLVSAPAPSGLATSTAITITFSASTTHGLISGLEFSGIPNAAPIDKQIGNFVGGGGVVNAHWVAQLHPGYSAGGVMVYAVAVDNTGNSTADPDNEGSEVHDFNDAAFFGCMTTGYRVVAPNQLARATGVWSTISGSVSHNAVFTMRSDDNSYVYAPRNDVANYMRM